MLAVQHAPRMGSSDPSNDPFLPFGYSVNPDEEPLLDPPEPPGDSLLTENDTRALGSFFEDMTNDQWTNMSFGEGLNFSNAWFDLPPTFVGSATSFGHQPEPPMPSPSHQAIFNDHMGFSRSSSGTQMMPPPPPPPPHSAPPQHQRVQQYQTQHQQIHRQHPIQPQHSNHHSDDVLTAAATLLHNNNNSAHRANAQDYSMSRHPLGPSIGHLRHQPLEEFHEDGLRATQQEQGFSTDWMQPHGHRSNAPVTAPVGFQWGSDSNFSAYQGYTPDENKETSESHQQEQLKLIECLEVNKSAASTRPSSPSNGQSNTTNHGRKVSTSDALRGREDPEAPPRKRRKSKNARDTGDNEEEEDATEAKPSRRRKSKLEKPRELSPSSESPSKLQKRRAASKAARENLSEEQKRSNHIKSEQKRRTLIKEGFDDLCDLVPGLKGGGFSKSTMLTMAAEWLEELISGNEVLLEQLGGTKR